MKKIFTLLALTISFIINAQMSDNSTGTSANGSRSVAMGSYTTASGDYSTAMGQDSTASGITSTAMGAGTNATGQRSTSMGNYTTASGSMSVAMGYKALAAGDRSVAMGTDTRASDLNSLVIGQYNSSGYSVTSADSFSTSAPAFVIGNGTTSNARSDAFKVMFNGDTYVSSSLYLGGTAITSTAAELNILDGVTSTATELNILDGVTATATEINLLDGVTTVGSGILSSLTENGNTGVRLSTANASNHGDIGSNAVDLSYSASSSSTNGATGDNSTAMGYSTTASDYASLVIGQYNSSGSSATSASSFSTSAPAFVIGNGTDSSNKSDAFKVMFDGTTTIAGDLTINSDARLKANITSLGGTLAKLLKIDGKSYTMKKDQSEKQKIGLLAQDIQKVFPELVLESQGIKSVNYQGLVPVIINALKEQYRKMKEQDRKMREQEERLERLERLVANMD